MDMDQFELDRTIDPNQLDVEAVRQADLFFKWAQQAIAAKSEVDRQEFDLKVLEAKLQLACREDPESFGLRSVTEAGVKAAVQCSSKYVDALATLFRAKENAALLDKAVMAMEQKKRMLEILVTLHGQQYFAGPSVPRSLVDAWQQHQSKSSEALGGKQLAAARRRVRRER